MQNLFITQAELIHNSFRTDSEHIQNSSRTHSELIQNSLRARSKNQNSGFSQDELVPLELAGRISTARTRRTNWYR